MDERLPSRGLTDARDPVAIELTDISHRFPTAGEVVRVGDVTFAAGSFTAVVGPSGGGKSTLFRIMAGLLTPTTGAVALAGHDVTGRPGEVVLHPQRDLLLPWRRVVANAALGARVAGVDRSEADAAARAEMDRFGLAGFERAWPRELSGGMRQRLALLRSFLVPRPALLLDEPFGALDAITRSDLHRWLEGVWLDDHRTTVVITHDVEEALVLADRVLVLSSRPGRIALDLPVDLPRPRPADIVTSPEFNAARAELLAALGGA